MKLLPFSIFLALALTGLAPCQGFGKQPPAGPFTTTQSNTVPLAFGMTVQAAADALGSPLSYVSRGPNQEILLAIRSNGGSGFFPRRNRLYLQFRAGRLSGWKGDWDHNWMWQ